jgi:hypothetical protein
MPTEDALLRVEASVVALEPMVMDDETMVGFYPPSLGSLRCDVMRKLGELEEVSNKVKAGEEDAIMPLGEEEVAKTAKYTASPNSSDSESGLDAIRDALRL